MTDHEMFMEAMKALTDRRYGPSHITRYSTGEMRACIGERFPRILDFQYDARDNKTFYVRKKAA